MIREEHIIKMNKSIVDTENCRHLTFEVNI